MQAFVHAHCGQIAGSLGGIVANILAVSLAFLDVNAPAVPLAVGVAPVVVGPAVLPMQDTGSRHYVGCVAGQLLSGHAWSPTCLQAWRAQLAGVKLHPALFASSFGSMGPAVMCSFLG